MKQELTEAAERCFTLPKNKQWYGYSGVTQEDAFEHCYWCFNHDDVHELDKGAEDGPWSVWFLLLCAEALND